MVFQLLFFDLSCKVSSRICTGQRAENRFTALDGDIILVPDRVLKGRRMARELLFKVLEKK